MSNNIITSALSMASSHRPLTSAPTAQRLSLRRCSNSTNAGPSCAALASRASFSLSHSHNRPRPAPCSPAHTRPTTQLSSRIRLSPSKLPSAQNTLTGVWPLPSAAKASPAPLTTAITASTNRASRAPCSQCSMALSKPSRSASHRARFSMRAGKSPPVVRARRLASRSSNGPACASRRRTVSVSQRRCKGES